MAKLTEKEVVEQIINADINFFDELEEEKEYKELQEIYKEEEKLAEKAEKEAKPFEEIQEQMKNDFRKIIAENYFIDTHETWNGEYGPDASWDYSDNLYINGHLLIEDTMLHDHWDRGDVLSIPASQFEKIIDASLKLKEELDKHVIRYNELLEQPEVVEYNNLQNQIDELSKQKGLGAKLKLAQLNSKKKKMLKNPAVKEFDDIIKVFDVNLYNKLEEVIPVLQEKNEKYRKAKEDEEKVWSDLKSKFKFSEDEKYSLWYWEEDRINNKLRELDKKIKGIKIPREKATKLLILAQFYREHEAEYKDDRKTLLMIYAENMDKELKEDFKTALSAYDKAINIAKTEGKADFKKLTILEQLDYFEAGKKVIKAEKEFGKLNNGDGKQ